MNCLLFGIGPHAKRIYIKYLLEDNQLEKLFIVDLFSNKEKINDYMKKINLEYELILLPDCIRNSLSLDKNQYNLIKEYVEKNNIKKAIISTEPRSHLMYIKFCLDLNLDIMCDKPITAPLYTNTKEGYNKIIAEYELILNKYKNSKSELFEIQTQRRAHRGYVKIKEIISDVVKKYNVPITNVTISHSDGNWNMPNEVIERENHPYKYGYGKMFHSGYHFLDLLNFFLEVNESNGFKMENKKVNVVKNTPADFYNSFNKEFFEKIGFENNSEFFDNLELIKNFGELDMHSLIEYRDQNGFLVTTANLELTQSGFSKRSWFELPEDTYKGNGRVRHEYFNITVGPLINIKVLSFQSTEISEGNINDFELGGLDHFEVLVFRNDKIIGGKGFERLLFTEDKKVHSYLGHNESARFNLLYDYFHSDKSHSNIESHKNSIELLHEIYGSVLTNNPKFRFAVEIILIYKGKVLLCKRRQDLKVAPGMWNVPAGKVKYAEGLEEAMVRETKEETNLNIENVKYLGFSFINKESHQRIVYTYLTEITDISNMKIEEDEFSEYSWINPSDVKEYKVNQHLQEHILNIEVSNVCN